VSASRTAALVVLGLAAFALGPPAIARADSFLGRPGRAGRPPEYERGPDRIEGLFWREQERQRDKNPPPALPGLFPAPPPALRHGPPRQPGPGGATKTGPLTFEQLRLVKDGRGGYRGRRPGYSFAVARDGTIRFDDKPPVSLAAAFLLGMVGVFDLTDIFMRMVGEDPYSYDKARVIELTQSMRDRMTDGDRQRRIAEGLAALPAALEAVWARADLPPAARRTLLFALWDEMAEQGEGPEAQAGRRARALILDFVRERAPAGGGGFSPEELTRLNAGRRSRAAFAPYAARE
jgi:hypothetical protein